MVIIFLKQKTKKNTKLEARERMSKIIIFPVKEKTLFIKELNYQKFQKKIDRYLAKGYKIIRSSPLYKETGFGGVTSYFAELIIHN